MANWLRQMQLHTFFRLHPGKKEKHTVSTRTEKGRVKRNMENQEKEITIIGEQRESAEQEEETHMAQDAVSVCEEKPDDAAEDTAERKNPEVMDFLFRRREPKETTGSADAQDAEIAAESIDPQDDFLLSQIDEFRVKAQQLQQLLRVKEDKAKELQQIVNERTDKAEELQQIVNERQEKADGITAEVAKQIDGMSGKVNASLESVNEHLDSMSRTMDTRLEQVHASVADLGSIRESVEKLKDQQEMTDRRVQETGRNVYDMTGQLQEIRQTSNKLDEMKIELSDKIHTESVQSYRNTQELIRAVDEKLNKIDIIDKGVHSIKNMSAAILVLTVIDLLGVAAAVVLSLGLF